MAVVLGQEDVVAAEVGGVAEGSGGVPCQEDVLAGVHAQMGGVVRALGTRLKAPEPLATGVVLQQEDVARRSRRGSRRGAHLTPRLPDQVDVAGAHLHLVEVIGLRRSCLCDPQLLALFVQLHCEDVGSALVRLAREGPQRLSGDVDAGVLHLQLVSEVIAARAQARAPEHFAVGVQLQGKHVPAPELALGPGAVGVAHHDDVAEGVQRHGPHLVEAVQGASLRRPERSPAVGVLRDEDVGTSVVALAADVPPAGPAQEGVTQEVQLHLHRGVGPKGAIASDPLRAVDEALEAALEGEGHVLEDAELS